MRVKVWESQARGSTSFIGRCSSVATVQSHRKHGPGRIEVELAIEPGAAALQDVGAVLLQCVRGLTWGSSRQGAQLNRA